MIIEKIIEGINVTVCDKPLNSSYVVFQNKIWRKTGSEGSGIHYAMKLERSSIVKWIHNKEFKQVEYIAKPTGYIDLEKLAMKDDSESQISQGQYIEFCKEVFDMPFQRIGQYFCNKFDIRNDELFYEEDRNKAMGIITKYIKFKKTNRNGRLSISNINESAKENILSFLFISKELQDNNIQIKQKNNTIMHYDITYHDGETKTFKFDELIDEINRLLNSFC